VKSNLKSTLFIVLAVSVGALLMSRSALAHHGANLYDMSKAVVLKGTVTRFYWGNPHNEVSFDVMDDKGEVAHWVAYTEPPLVMLERGWTRKSIPMGDMVTVYIFVAKNGSTVGTLNKIVLADGQELTAYGAPAATAPQK
jgi:hypothetical protein